jgi:hypothetical protein
MNGEQYQGFSAEIGVFYPKGRAMAPQKCPEIRHQASVAVTVSWLCNCLAVLLISLSVFGCSKLRSNAISGTEDKIVGTIGNPIHVGTFIYKAGKPTFYKASDQKGDAMFLVIPLEILNVGKVPKIIDGSMVKLADQIGNEYYLSSAAMTDISGKNDITSLYLTYCHPNIISSGVLIFDVFDETSRYTLKIGTGNWNDKFAEIAVK